jgi:HK97 gp10 family phage protein
MSERTFDVPGLADLFKQLDELPVNIEKKLLRGALRAGQKVIMDLAKVNVPVSPPSKEDAKNWGAYAGALRDSIKISTRINRRTGQAEARLTAGNKKAFYATFVEFGTKPHQITSYQGKRLLGTPGHPVYVVHHPGAKKIPFMRNAIDAGVQGATVAFADYLRTRVNAELAKQPDESDA